MKRRNSLTLLITCAMTLSFAGCGAETAKNDEDSEEYVALENDSEEAEVSSNEPEDDALSISLTDEEYTVAEICEGLRDDWNNWSQDYKTSLFDWVMIGDKYYYYGKTYPENEWSVEEVAEYFRESYYRWGCEIGDGYYEATKFYLWTPDYEHGFCADTTDNWLYIDGVKAAPLELETYSMNPEDLVQAFQNRSWDGVELRYSDDFSTSVVMEPEYGLLEYSFWAEYPSEEKDPNGLAYTGYTSTIPWWMDETQDYDAVAMADSRYAGFGGLDVPDYYEYDGTFRSKAWVVAYVDVPWELQNTLLAVQHAGEFYYENHYNGSHYGQTAKHAYYAKRTSDGLYALTDSGVELWLAGRLRQVWRLKITEDSYLVVDFEGSGRNFAYTDGKLYELFDDGKTDMLIDNIVSVNLRYKDRDVCSCFTLEEDGALHFWDVSYYGQWLVDREIATDVVAADLSNEFFVLYTDTAGKTYVIYDFLGSDAGLTILCREDQCYKIGCLGEGSIEDFKALYDEMYSKYTDYTYERFVEDMLSVSDDSGASGTLDASDVPDASGVESET